MSCGVRNIVCSDKRVMAAVVITQYQTGTGRAIAEALDARTLEPSIADRHVALKPNDTWASTGNTTGSIQANALRAVLRAVKAHRLRELA